MNRISRENRIVIETSLDPLGENAAEKEIK